ncbi:MAG: ParB/RepB/Spo0J family partition protein [Candidatus Paceibacterota bacterium]
MKHGAAVALKEKKVGAECIMTMEEIQLMEVGRTYEVERSLIRPNPSQPRKIFNEIRLKGTAGSIKKRGVEDPIKVVIKKDADGALFLRLIDGERRWRSAEIAGLKTITCLLKPEMTDDEIYLSSAKANCDRESLNPIEEAGVIVEFKRRFGWSQARSAEELGMSQGYASNLLKYLNLCVNLRDKLMKGEIDKAVALNLASFPPDKQENLHTQFMKKTGGKKLNPRDIPRVMKGVAKKIEVAPRTSERGKKHATHPDLVVSNFERAIDNLNEAIRELNELTDDEIAGQEACHIIDLINLTRNCHENIGTLMERIDGLD